MRTPRLPLGIFVIALVVTLLMAACGGPDAQTNGPSGPSSERVPAEPTSPETDREALVALYNATGGPNWNSNDNWLSDMPIREWYGVTTDDGRVIVLDLMENQLSGEIPPELGNLTNLIGLAAQREPAERGDTTGVGQPRQPEIAGYLR